MKNFLTKMLDALTSAYSRRDHDNQQQLLPLETNIGKLFSVFAWGLDSVQEQADLIRLWDDLEYACGSVLDRYGANFGVKRISSDDRFYRLAIKVKMMAILSGGDTDTVIQAASELLGIDPTNISYEDVFPAKIALYVDFEILSQDRRDLIEPIAYAIKRILAAGVGMRLYLCTYRTYHSNLLFLRCGYSATQLSSEPVSQNRKNIQEQNIKHGGFAASVLPSAFPNFQKSYAESQGYAGGGAYHTHIKSKRIG